MSGMERDVVCHRSGNCRSPGTMKLNHFLESGHSWCRSNFAIWLSPNLRSSHSRVTISFCPWRSALQRYQTATSARFREVQWSSPTMRRLLHEGQTPRPLQE